MTIKLPLAFLASTALIGLGSAAMAQTAAGSAEPERPSIAVVGTGEAFGTPNLAMTSLTVLRTAETADAALTDANEAVRAVTQAMRDLGIESRDLQTAGFSITPQYRYENREDGTTVPPQIVGYEVRNTLSVRVRDLDRLGELLDQAVSLGVNQGGDIAFQIEDPSVLRDEARRDAVAQARQSAEVLAEAAGMEIGDVISIVDEPATSFPPVPMRAEMRLMAAPASDSVPVEVGENRVEARVRVVWELDEAGAP